MITMNSITSKNKSANRFPTACLGGWRGGLFLLLFCSCLVSLAQPPARLRQQAREKQHSTTQAAVSSSREFPTAQAMPEDAAWRRDIYRQLDLTKDENAVLYFPTTPQGGRMNLFTFLFKQMLRGKITAYDYTIDGNENFSEKNIVKAKELMDRYEIFYESKDGKIRVNDADLPSDQVKSYFVKESVYYDQRSATFRSKVTALCPVLLRGSDDFSANALPYPMFWVKYDDIASQLSKLMLMGSSYNNAAVMSADDYFTMNCYKGDIYKTTNLQDKILSNYCETDTAMRKEQNRIERQLVDFQDHVWGRDSVAMAKAAAEAAKADSIAALDKKSSKRFSRRSSGRSRSAVSSKSSTPSVQKESKSRSKSKTKVKSASPSRSGGGFSVRRERR